MIVHSPEKYRFVKFVKSHLPSKKYNAILMNKETKKYKIVPFGQIREDGTPYEQYKDSTGLGLYSKYDHLDRKRRALYRERHEGEDKNKFSSGYFAMKFLW